MRSLALCSCVLAVACSNDVDPRVIAGGGVGDGEIDGEINVHVIDGQTDEPIANATVRVGSIEKDTNEDGLVTFEGVEGKQTVVAVADDYRATVWVGVNGANVTVPLTPFQPATPDSAVLSGTIEGWTQDLAQGHLKAAIVLYSQTDALGDDANNLPTPAQGNICFGVNTCAWNVVTRTGKVTLAAAIVDRDGMGTPQDDSDDTNTIIGWAIKEDITVEDGVNQSGMTLTPVEVGNLQEVTLDLGTPPAGLTEVASLLGIEIGDDQVVQIPTFVLADPERVLAPKPDVFADGTAYRLTAVAATTMGDDGAQSILLRQNQSGTALEAGEWLVPPTNVTGSRTTGSFAPTDGARLHQVAWIDTSGEARLEITIFDGTTEVEVPSLVTLPSGALQVRAQAIGADFDLSDFSLEDDGDLLWGIAAEPVDVN